MANYKLITSEPTGTSSVLVFQAGATNTVVASVSAFATATSDVLEVLIKKNGGSVIEIAKKTAASASTPEEMLTAPVALEALDELYVRTSRTGAKFVVTYVEETDVPSDTALGGLADVDTTGVTDGQSLVYSSATSQWEPQTVSGGGGGASDLDGLSDVVITSASTGKILRHNGTNWVDSVNTTDIVTEGTNLYYTDARADARIAAASFGDLNDVDLTGLTSGDGLEWDGTNWVPTTSAGGNHAFHQIAVVGQTVVEADSANDVLELAEGTGINITTDATNDKITFAVDATADEIDDTSTTNKFVTQTELDKLGHITITQAVDLDATELVANTAFATSNANQSSLANLTASIQNHTDVVLSQSVPANLPDDVFLQWDANTLKWNDKVLTLDDHDNVDLTTTAPTNGDILEFDGTNFVPVAPTAVPSSIDNLTDVDTSTTSPSTGDVLEWDGSNWVPAAPSGGGSNIHDTDTTFTNAGDYDAGADLMDFTTTALTLAAGKPYALASTGWAVASNADSSSNAMIAVCTSDSTTGSAMLLRGLVRASDTLSGNIGDPVYLGTGSKWTMTAPTSGASVVVLGRLIDATNNVVWFDPDKTVITLQ